MHPHVLDRPVWSALSTRQANRATGTPQALRMGPEYGVFAASADASPGTLEALAALAPPGGEIWLVERHDFPLPPNLQAVSQSACLQMILSRPTLSVTALDAELLGEPDAPEMLELATLTKPGPFFSRTHRLGRFIGVRKNGELIAMAGERMQPTGFTEVSGVCTRPGHRGKGLAGALMHLVVERILARGETPFLHVYASNTGAVALYEKLGFSVRREITMTVLRHPA